MGEIDMVVDDVSVGTFVSLSPPSAPPQAVSATTIIAATVALTVVDLRAVVTA